MNIAIIGAGFCGLSAAWHLLQKKHTVTLFDSKGIGGGASGIATGLMHPYAGEQGRRSDRACEGLDATHDLLKIAEEFLGLPVCKREGILRYVQNDEQRQMFRFHITRYNDVEEVSEDGFLITSGVTVYCGRYLEGLWKAIESKGGRLVLQNIDDLNSLIGYDLIIIAAGAGVKHFPECRSLKLSLVKGQVLICKGSHELPSMVSKGSITPTETPGICHVGATYERNDLTDIPNIEVAKADLFPKVAKFYPEVESLEILGCKAGLRVGRIGHYFPLILEVKPGVWAFTALGSRGLLYHGLLGRDFTSL